MDTLILVCRRRIFVALFTGAVAVIAVIVVLLIPRQYTADTLLLPPAQNSSISSALLSQFGGSAALASVAGSSLGIKNPSDMYIALFHSRAVEDAIIQRFDLMTRYRAKRMTDARSAFEEHSSVGLGVKDGLIRITVRDRDPNMAAGIANAYVDEYRRLSANLAISEASQRRLFFEQQLQEANGSLTTAEEAMKRMQQTTGILQIDSQARSLIESAAELRAQVASKEVQLQAMHSYATDSNPDVVVAKQQLAGLQAQLGKLSGDGGDSSADMIVPKGKVPEAEMEYIRKLRDVKYYETITELIAKQLEGARLDEAHQGATIQVIDAAIPPDNKSSPHRAFIVVLATLLAFVTSVFWVLASARWREALHAPQADNKLRTLVEVFSKKEA